MLGDHSPQVLGIVGPGRLDRQAGAAIESIPAAEHPALQRMHLLELGAARKDEQELGKMRHADIEHGGAAQDGLDMLGRVIDLPGVAIDAFPLLLAHAGMGGQHVFEVVFVHVGVHPDPLLP